MLMIDQLRSSVLPAGITSFRLKFVSTPLVVIGGVERGGPGTIALWAPDALPGRGERDLLPCWQGGRKS
jgi:hypothetical protein